MKNSNDNIGNRTRKLRLVAQFFNQLRHRVLPIKVLFTPYTVILITYIYIYIYTGRFIMFSVITNIYKKKTKGHTLMELFTGTGKLKKSFFLTTRDVRCVHHE